MTISSSSSDVDPLRPFFLAVDQLFGRKPDLDCCFKIVAVEKKERRRRRKIEMHSPLYYLACTVGGVLSCGLTHLAITPLDLVKCNMQIDPIKYKSIKTGIQILLKEQGFQSLFKGWLPTLIGYGLQGAFKFGFYEFFKTKFSDFFGPDRKSVVLLASASAELAADVALCPFEAVKVRVQTVPGFAIGLCDGFPKFVKSDGFLGLYKGLLPLWARQIPYTMMKFVCFESIVNLIYKHIVPKRKDETPAGVQLAVCFAGGYLAGVLCAVISQPADNLVSFLNNTKGATFHDAVRNLGIWNLFTRGLLIRIIMIGTLTGAQWGIYNAFRVSLGLPTSGGHNSTDSTKIKCYKQN